MKKSELQKLIKEELRNILKEEYTELITMDPNFEKGFKLILTAWVHWVNGPETESQQIPKAKKELIQYLTREISKW